MATSTVFPAVPTSTLTKLVIPSGDTIMDFLEDAKAHRADGGIAFNALDLGYYDSNDTMKVNAAFSNVLYSLDDAFLAKYPRWKEFVIPPSLVRITRC